jgi:transcriptional regulator with XRE-family HTH domain
MDIAEKILDICRHLDITPNKLATMADIPPTTMQDIVNRRNKNPQIDTIKKICDGLDMPLAKFFMEEKPEFTPEALIELKNYKDYLRYKYRIDK